MLSGWLHSIMPLSEGYPLIIADGKLTDENVDWVKALAASYERRFYGKVWPKQFQFIFKRF